MVSVIGRISQRLRIHSKPLPAEPSPSADPSLPELQPHAHCQQAVETRLQQQKADYPAALRQLLEEQPSFHAIYGGAQPKVIEAECCNWGIEPDILTWILSYVGPEACTLETGCGYSSIAFALASRQHTVISPVAEEHQAIQRWCQDHDLDLSHVTFWAEQSQDMVHRLESTPLDVVLIDGNHAFPTPFIDWYYTAERVKPGGYVLVDDTQLITGKILRDFLASETGRWVLEADLGQTSVFRRVTEASVTRGFWWGQQPYCEQPLF